MFILIALVIGAGLLPEPIEGRSCYSCSGTNCFFSKEIQTTPCGGGYYCYFSFNPRYGTQKDCAREGNKTFEAECTVENDERIKKNPNLNYGPSCFDDSKFKEVIKPCIERKWKEANKNVDEYKLVVKEKDLSRTGGDGKGAEGSNLSRSGVEEGQERSVTHYGWDNWETCYCDQDLCNGKAVPEYSEIFAPDPVNCYSCSGESECRDMNKKDSYPEIKLCPIPYCMTKRTIPMSKSTSEVAVVERGCVPWSDVVFDKNLGLQGSIERILECYRKGLKNGCRSSGRLTKCLKAISKYVHRSPKNERTEECLCEGELCNLDPHEPGEVNGSTRAPSRTILLSFILIQGLFTLMG